MINIEELRADIEAGTPGDWRVTKNRGWSINTGGFNGYAFIGPKGRTPVMAAVSLRGLWVDPELDANIRRAIRLPQLEREYLAMREALEYYAEKSHYDSGEVPGHIYVLDDGGRYARKALGETE